MNIRIHFAVGSTAMAKTFALEGVGFLEFVRQVERNRRDDTVMHFGGKVGESFSLASRSIVFVEEA